MPASAWYAESTQVAYELGLVNGSSKTAFNPNGNITVAEALALACRLHSIYNANDTEFVPGSPWYQVYVDYAMENGLITQGQFTSYTNKATRAQFAVILAAALPQDALTAINSVVSIPDVPAIANYAGSVYLLYNAGILTGNDAYGTFAPDSSMQRSGVAAIVTRMAATSMRKTFVLSDKPIAATGISLNQTSATISDGETLTLTATIAPATAADKTVKWSSTIAK